MCDGGVATWKRSSAVSPRACTQCAVPAPIERWVCRTAFGRPVVPELNTRMASSSGPTSRGVERGRRRARAPSVVEVGDGVGARAARRAASTAGPSATAWTGAGEGQGVVDLGRLPRRAQQHGGGAELADGVDGDGELHPVGRHHRHPVARTDAAVGEVVGERGAQPVEVGERPLVVVERAPRLDRRARRPPAPAPRAAAGHALDASAPRPQLVLHDLAGGVDGSSSMQLDAARHLVVGHLGPAPLDDLVAGGRRPRARDDERHAHLAEPRVGDADDRDLLDVGVAQQGVLDLGRVGVEPADDEHVLRAADDAQAPVVVDRSRGRRCRASRRRRHGGGGGLGVVEVVRHDAAAPQRGSRPARPGARRGAGRRRSAARSSAAAGRRWWRWSRGRRRATVAAAVPPSVRP